MTRHGLVLALLVAGGCARGGAETPTGDADNPPGDDAPVRVDGPARIDAEPIDAPPARAKHVLLTEVMLAPTGAEFIEIVNSTGAAVDLSTYYLSDRGDYWKLPLGTGSANLPASTTDFIAQFPSGTTIANNQVMVIAIGSVEAFTNATTATADFGVKDTTSKAMVQTLVGSQAGLTDSGEPIVLFQWNGSAPLVKDVDIFLAGAPVSPNQLVNKSGASQGGAAYQIDKNLLPTQAAAPAGGMSTKRTALEPTGHEDQAGTGNGITGDDETSEDTTLTWDQTGFTPATPGQVPAQLTPL